MLRLESVDRTQRLLDMPTRIEMRHQSKMHVMGSPTAPRLDSEGPILYRSGPLRLGRGRHPGSRSASRNVAKGPVDRDIGPEIGIGLGR